MCNGRIPNRSQIISRLHQARNGFRAWFLRRRRWSRLAFLFALFAQSNRSCLLPIRNNWSCWRTAVEFTRSKFLHHAWNIFRHSFNTPLVLVILIGSSETAPHDPLGPRAVGGSLPSSRGVQS